MMYCAAVGVMCTPMACVLGLIVCVACWAVQAQVLSGFTAREGVGTTAQAASDCHSNWTAAGLSALAVTAPFNKVRSVLSVAWHG